MPFIVQYRSLKAIKRVTSLLCKIKDLGFFTFSFLAPSRKDQIRLPPDLWLSAMFILIFPVKRCVTGPKAA